MSAPHHPAIFLSYAREDVDAARRISDALRSHGLEVWFDQNELRGGEVWDQKIRRQIKECTLFVPIVSTQTQERKEGYFRLEWKLAVERTHLMAEGVPFLAPVVVDDTKEATALVPAEFMRVQWTRLPGALVTPQFVDQIKRLLALPATSPSTSAGVPAPNAAPTAERRAPPAGKSAFPTGLVVALGVAVVGLLAFIVLRPAPKTAVADAAPATKPTNPSPAPAAAATRIHPKSIAVLPLSNMSEDKDTGFFADGVHEDLLTNLAVVPELKVVSRTSMLQYRGTTKSMKQIGEELGVAYILEGSVRRSGNRVRVTAQLINPRTDEHAWAKSYDKDLTDIFAIQAALSQEITTALLGAISPDTRKLLDRKPTENVAAYDLLLKARDTRNREPSGATSLSRQENLLSSAVALDPNFAIAWADLATVHGQLYFTYRDRTENRRAQAKAAIDRAVALAPELPDVIRSLGNYHFLCFRDYPRATEQLQKLLRLQPNDANGYASLANIQTRQGLWLAALANLRKATELEPTNLSLSRSLVTLLLSGRRYDEAKSEQQRQLEFATDKLVPAYELASIAFRASGSTKEIEGWLASLTPEQRTSSAGLDQQRTAAYMVGNLREYMRLDQLIGAASTDGLANWNSRGRAHLVLKALGDEETLRVRQGNYVTEMRSRLELEPTNAQLWLYLGVSEAMLGHREEALKCGKKLIELVPESIDADDGPSNSRYYAMIRAWTGDKEAAITEMGRLLRIPARPGFFGVHPMRTSPFFVPLRGDPRFEALLNDPKNNAPLF